jgi:hypothetical protein
MAKSQGWRRLGAVGLVIWLAAVLIAIQSDQKGACQWREDWRFADLLRAEYEKIGRVGPNLSNASPRTFSSQAIDVAYSYPLPEGRLQAVINQANAERYSGNLCAGTYWEVASKIVPYTVVFTALALFLLFGLFKTIGWVTRGFSSR